MKTRTGTGCRRWWGKGTRHRHQRRLRRLPTPSVSRSSSSLLIAAPPHPSLSNPTYNDTGQSRGSSVVSSATVPSSNASSSTAVATAARKNSELYRGYNCPMRLSQFVEKRCQQRQEQQRNVLFVQLDLNNDNDDNSSSSSSTRRSIMIPDDRTRTLWHRQIVRLNSMPSHDGSYAAAAAGAAPNGVHGTNMLPPYELVLKACYVLSAWMTCTSTSMMMTSTPDADHPASLTTTTALPTSHVAVLYGCGGKGGPRMDATTAALRSGKSACALVAACWLKYSGQVETIQQGLDHVLASMLDNGPQVSGPTNPPESPTSSSYWESVPPSVRRYLTQFDQWVDRDGICPNSCPLLLRAISLQGLPVDAMPVVEVYGHPCGASRRSRLLYSSSTSPLSHDASTSNGSCQWAEEEGFFELGSHVVLEGEFSIVVKFADDDLDDYDNDDDDDVDASRIILRYVGHAGFLRPGIHDADATQVDVARPYEGAILYEGSDFLLSIVVDAHWSLPPADARSGDANATAATAAALRPSTYRLGEGGWKGCLPVYYPHGVKAQECGWQLIAQNHAARPTPDDVRHFRLVSGMDGTRQRAPPDHMVSLALQLSNFDVPSAQAWLSHRFYAWWNSPQPSPVPHISPPAVHGMPILPPPMSAEDKRKAMLKILERAGCNVPRADAEIEQGDTPPPATRSRPDSTFPMHLETSLMVPNAGDVYKSFWKTRDPYELLPSRNAPVTRESKPVFPFHRPSPGTLINNKLDDPRNAAAVETLMKIQHAGITLEDLLDLSKAIKTWTPEHEAARRAADSGKTVGIDERALDELTQRADPSTIPPNSMPSEDGDIAAALSPTTGDSTDKPTSDPKEYDTDLPLKCDPKFEKYFRMLDKGLPDGAVRNALQRDGLDPSLLDLDPSKSYASQTATTSQVAELVDVPLKSDPKFEKYFRMLDKGLPERAVRNALQRDGLDPGLLDLDPDRSYESQTAVDASTANSNGPLDGSSPLLKDDPRFEKYFRMLDKGLPEGAVRNALVRDGVDTRILDLNPDQTYESQAGPAAPAVDGASSPVLKDDPRFEKYFRMLDKGLPEGAVRNALVRDGVDTRILDLNPNQSYESQAEPASPAVDAASSPVLKDDPRFEKYFRMLDKGLPEGAVRNALVRDGVDTRILDLNPNQTYESQNEPAATAVDGASPPVLKDDPRFEKYFRMLAKGLPGGAVRNALVRDGVDTRILDLDPDKSYDSQTGPTAVDGASPPVLKDDPRFEKYFRMLDKGLPDGAVRNALVRDGVDTRILDLDPDKSYESQIGASAVVSVSPVLNERIDSTVLEDPGTRLSAQTPRAGLAKEDVALKNDPTYEKYFRMIEKGLPMGAVRNALLRDGLDPSILELDANRSLSSQVSPPNSTPIRDTGIPLREDPDWKKYFAMLKMGLPLGAVKNAVVRDGKDPTFMDLDPHKSLEFQLQSDGVKLSTSAKKKKRVRRKKIYWTPIDPGQVKEDSLWSIVRGKVQMSRLKYDVQEFEDLFTESADPSDQNRRKAALATKKVKKSVQVIDGKRSMNGGIILLRLKMDYKVIAKMVDDMEVGQLDATQLQALKENLPTEDEKKGLQAYMKGAGTAEDEKRLAYVQLSECEKYMLTMIDVENAAEKFDCMLYRVQFKPRLTEILDAIRTVETACNEVRNSDKLREIMALILTLVNEINTGGDGKMAVGFSLEALLKLNEAKAFDRKTSVLQYLVRLITSNDSQLLDFRSDLIHVSPAENIILDSLLADIKCLEDELERVLETAKAQADMFEAEGRVQPFSIQELKEQKTAVRNIDNVPQYNQIQHLTGRTSMERFAFNADRAIKDAVEHARKVKESYAKLLDYMCESEEMASNDFFGTMRRFAKEFEKAREQVEKEEKAKKREKAKLASGKRISNRKVPPSAGPVASSPASTDGGSIVTSTASEVGDADAGSDATGTQLLGKHQTGSATGLVSSTNMIGVPGLLDVSTACNTMLGDEEANDDAGGVSVAPSSCESHSGMATPLSLEATGEFSPTRLAPGAADPTLESPDDASSAMSGVSAAPLLGALALPSPDEEEGHRHRVAPDKSAIDQLHRPTPMSIGQMAAAAAAKRAVRRMEESPDNVSVCTSQASEPPSSPRRSQVSSSPPSSPSRIASLLATKLFGWPSSKDEEDVVEEVDV